MSKRPLPKIIQKPVTVIGYPPTNDYVGSLYTSKRGWNAGLNVGLNEDTYTSQRIVNPNKKQRNIQTEGYIYWDDGEKLAVLATTPQGMRNFEDYVRLLEILLHCDMCKNHFIEYKRKNPLSDYKNIKDDTGKYIGYFVWWFILHNTVNERTGKPLMQFNDV